MRLQPLVMTVLFVLASVMSGCLADTEAEDTEDDATSSEPETDEATDSFELTDCLEQFGLFKVPSSQAEPYLPDGFEPAGTDGTPLTDGTAVLVGIALTCDGPAENGTTTQFWTDLIVEPPEAYADEDAAFHYLHVTGVVTGTTVHDTWAAWGMPRMAGGEVTFETGDGPLVDTAESHATNGTLGATLSTTAAEPQQTAPGASIRLFGVENRTVTAIVDVSFGAYTGNAGEVALEDDGLVPFDIEGPGAGGIFGDYDATFRTVDLPDRSGNAA